MVLVSVGIDNQSQGPGKEHGSYVGGIDTQRGGDLG